MSKPQKKAALPNVELLPDAWARFERGVRAAAKAGPQPKPTAKPRQKKTGSSGSRVGDFGSF
jgi:hypothetical protein